MEDLKFKFFGLIQKQNQSKIPSMGLNPELLHSVDGLKHDNIQSEISHLAESESILDEDILESIESVYFEVEGSFDFCRHELNKLPHNLNCKDLEKYYKKLKKQQQVVSKKVLQLILQKQSAYNREYNEILNLQNQLKNVLEICRIGRFNLNVAKQQFTTASLGILASYNRKRVIQNLLGSLNTIKTLQRTEDRLQELLSEENYPGAISLLLEYQSAAKTYNHFDCVAALNGKLQDTLEQAEETLDLTLARICKKFDENTYSSIQEAYKLMGKTQAAVDQLHMHFTATIHNTASAVVHSSVGGDIKREYKQLCQSVRQDNFIPCLTELSKALWRIISSYYQVFDWHKRRERYTQRLSHIEATKVTIDDQYVNQKLEMGMMKIWHDVERKISAFLMSTNLTTFKFEQFVQVLGIVNKLMEAGEELCGSKSENLQESMRKQCLLYFAHYHASRMDELQIFLEHDGWELCPVKSTFVATQLQEFRSLRPSLVNCKSWSSVDGSSTSDKNNSITGGWFQKYLESHISPFDVGFDEMIDEDILMKFGDEQPSEYFSDDSEDDIAEVLKMEFLDEIDQSKNSKKKSRSVSAGPMVTNTTLSVLRVCGRYLQMSRLLSSIAGNVIQNMIQFFELCFYTIHSFFASDLRVASDSLYTPKLKMTLARIKENLIIDENIDEHQNKTNKIRQPQLSSMVALSSDKNFFGLTERIVGVESLIFLGQQYENLQDYLKQLIGKNSPEHRFLTQFYTQTVASAIDMRKPVYMALVSHVFDVANVLTLMNRVNWEVKDVMSQHSEYVDVLLDQIEVVAKRIDHAHLDLFLTSQVRNAIWENVAHLITHTIVEGFSNAKKCSNGGRGLMQLDFTQLKSKFEKITSIRPMPHSEYVETYVKAYYIPENILEEWLKNHKEYSSKHLIGLISCACQNNKKSRQRLLAIVEEQHTNR